MCGELALRVGFCVLHLIGSAHLPLKACPRCSIDKTKKASQAEAQMRLKNAYFPITWHAVTKRLKGRKVVLQFELKSKIYSLSYFLFCFLFRHWDEKCHIFPLRQEMSPSFFKGSRREMSSLLGFFFLYRDENVTLSSWYSATHFCFRKSFCSPFDTIFKTDLLCYLLLDI